MPVFIQSEILLASSVVHICLITVQYFVRSKFPENLVLILKPHISQSPKVFFYYSVIIRQFPYLHILFLLAVRIRVNNLLQFLGFLEARIVFQHFHKFAPFSHPRVRRRHESPLQRPCRQQSVQLILREYSTSLRQSQVRLIVTFRRRYTRHPYFLQLAIFAVDNVHKVVPQRI